METKFFITHLIGKNLERILVSEDVGNFEKIQIEKYFSFPPFEVGSPKAKWLAEISNSLISFLFCRLHVLISLNLLGQTQ